MHGCSSARQGTGSNVHRVEHAPRACSAIRLCGERRVNAAVQDPEGSTTFVSLSFFLSRIHLPSSFSVLRWHLRRFNESCLHSNFGAELCAARPRITMLTTR